MSRTVLTLVFFAVVGLAQTTHAAYMSPISDLISDSSPSDGASHIITFKTHTLLPGSGSISIEPEDFGYVLPPGFDFNDVDLSVSNGGPYVDRELASAPGAGFDGVSLSGNTLILTLDSGSPIAADSMVRVTMGTAASHQAFGTHDPVNTSINGSYRTLVETSHGGTRLDDAKAMFVILDPVSVSLVMPNLAPNRFNGLPTGTLPGGSSVVELSLQTDKPSVCRYATSTGVAYGSMTKTFSSVGNTLHYIDVFGLINGTTYTFNVRCADANVPTLVNTDDFPIDFSVGPTPDVTTSDGTTANVQTQPAGAGGSGGTGDFPGGSSVLFLSAVTVSGKAPPGSSVTILKDGQHQLDVQANSAGFFSAKIPGLERGTYTFVAFAADAKQRKTSRFASTLTVGAGTNNNISGILLSPTVSSDSDSVDPGTDVHVSGTGIPGTTVGITVRSVPKSGAPGAPKEYTASSSADTANPGAWEFSIPAKDLARGTYQVQVKTIVPESSSMPSAPVFVGVGESPSQKNDTGNRSDINKDGKVNLVDFSILLTHWQGDDEDSDINGDGAINLADFSILLFNWTG